MYQMIEIHIPAMLFPIIRKRAMTRMAVKIKIYLILLFAKEKSLNFSANMGTSAISIQHERKMSNNRMLTLMERSASTSFILMTNEAQKRALAGVGRPMKELVWRSSKLNLANLNAENAAMRKAE